MAHPAAARLNKEARKAAAASAAPPVPAHIMDGLLANWISQTATRKTLVIGTHPRLRLEITRRTVKLGGGISRQEWYISDVFGNAFVSSDGFDSAERAQTRAVEIAQACTVKLAKLFGLIVD